MKNLFIIIILFTLVSCGYHLRTHNAISETYPLVKINISSQSLLKRPLINALISSGVKLSEETNTSVSELSIIKDNLQKVIQSIGANNQVQEYRLEYDVEYTIADQVKKTLHLEKDYSFDIQQIGGGQQEELTLRKQLADDMAWAIIRQINAQNITSPAE
jgi:outer membrane lipopolysaccharide assembly protein LptE/RlpB